MPGFKDLHVPASAGVPEAGVAAFLRNVQSIVAIARENGVTPVLLTFATCAACLEADDEDFLATVDRLNQGLREHAASWGAPLIDVAAQLSNRPELYDDWLHFSDEGSRALAHEVHEAAVEQGLFGL